MMPEHTVALLVVDDMVVPAVLELADPVVLVDVPAEVPVDVDVLVDESSSQ